MVEDDAVKYLAGPRHIEYRMATDTAGNEKPWYAWSGAKSIENRVMPVSGNLVGVMMLPSPSWCDGVVYPGTR